MAQVALRYTVNANLIFKWLRDPTLARIPDCKINKVDDLLPWHWNE